MCSLGIIAASSFRVRQPAQPDRRARSENGTTYYDYDRNNRMTRVVRPMLQETVFEYDGMGNRTAVVDAKGQKIAYTYDAANQLEQVDYYAAGDHVAPVKTVVFTYDELGNLKTYADGATSATNTYDDLSRRTGETIDYGPFSLSLAQIFYANGLKQTFTGPDLVTHAYAYDEGNRLASIDIAGQGSISYQYNPASWNLLWFKKSYKDKRLIKHRDFVKISSKSHLFFLMMLRGR